MPNRVKVTGGLYRGMVPDGAVYVGRAHPGLKQSPFANPWCVRKAVHSIDGTDRGWVVSWHRNQRDTLAGIHETRDGAVRRAVDAFETHLTGRPELRVLAAGELRGKDLACWCKPDQPCHADILLEIANTTGESPGVPG